VRWDVERLVLENGKTALQIQSSRVGIVVDATAMHAIPILEEKMKGRIDTFDPVKPREATSQGRFILKHMGSPLEEQKVIKIEQGAVRHVCAVEGRPESILQSESVKIERTLRANGVSVLWKHARRLLAPRLGVSFFFLPPLAFPLTYLNLGLDLGNLTTTS
jgi:hypothetical protein